MSIEKRKGLPIQALGLINKQEGLTSNGRRSYAMSYADGSGRVVFLGRAAQTASMLLDTYGDQTVSEARIANRFSTEYRGVRTLVSAVREGLEIAEIDLKIGKDTSRYFLAPLDEAGIDAGEESNVPSLKGQVSYEIPTRGKRQLTLTLEGSVAETFEHFWDYQDQPLTNLPNRVSRLNSVLSNSKTGIAVVEEQGEYVLQFEPGVEEQVREVWTIDVDDRPFIKDSFVESFWTPGEDIWPAEDYGLLDTEVTVKKSKRQRRKTGGPSPRKKRKGPTEGVVIKVPEAERERLRAQRAESGRGVRIHVFPETDTDRAQTYPHDERDDLIR